jgi:hypothetical protein
VKAQIEMADSCKNDSRELKVKEWSTGHKIHKRGYLSERKCRSLEGLRAKE